MELDFSEPARARCFIDCPATGASREVDAIIFHDGGLLTFPIDFSARGDPEQHEKALPKRAAGGSENCT
jgi:hypothetical protein